MDLNLQGPPGSQGSPGAPGLNGSAGSDGISIGVLVEAENSGSNCLQGGKKHSFFKDLNHSGTWNTGEGVLSVSFVCNGSPGTNGSQGAAGATGPNGINIGVLVETESAGSNCAFGGKKHSFFRDVNNNRLYDLGEEVLSVSFVCHGVSNGTIGTTVQPLLPGHKCFYGGINLIFYGDLDSDNVLDSNETVLSSADLCNGTTPNQNETISSSGSFSCAVTASSAAKCWGDNTNYYLGDGTTIQRTTPVYVFGQTAGIKAIATGANSCVLSLAGGVKCWGVNTYGQLGDGSTNTRSTPVNVVGLATGVKQIAVGQTHTCALTSVGGVKCWGGNSGGALGDGTTTNRLSPVDVVGLTSGVKQIASGGYHTTCAVTNLGEVKCWGANSSGELGDGTTVDKYTPTTVTGLPSGAISVSVGSSSGGFVCAVTTTGAAYCWGSNQFGVLGDGTTTNRLSPVAVTGYTSGVAYVAAGNEKACLLTLAGGVKCWGRNYLGSLGDGTTTDRLNPVDVVGLNSNVVGLSDGCAKLIDGSVKCWGSNSNGSLGNGTTTHSSVPVNVIGL